jgi:hypothetical protein
MERIFGDIMKTFEELYWEVLVRTLMQKEDNFLEKMELYDTHQLDCLLHPEKHPIVWHLGECKCEDDDRNCVKVCPFHAIHPGE